MSRLLTALSLTLICCGSVIAQENTHCDHERRHCGLPEDTGKTIADSRVFSTIPAPANTEELAADDGTVNGRCGAQAAPQALPFRISVDGIPLDGEQPAHAADSQRCVDLAAEKAAIQIRYDAQQQTPWLNVGAVPVTVDAGRKVRFVSYTNYPGWIKKAEIRLFRAFGGTQRTPLAVIAVDPGRPAEWTLPAGLEGELVYLLRVYDGTGRFDETRPKSLALSNLRLPPDTAAAELAVYGENSRLLGNIPVKGGSITVNGKNIQPGQRIFVMEEVAPVDDEGKFAIRRILPPGPHKVRVQLLDDNGLLSEFERNITIASDDWFYVGLADLTLGRNDTRGPAGLVTADDSDHFDNEVYLDGRLAFYLRGKIKGEYLLTAAADTREEPLEDLFSNFAAKDPRALLRRLDPDRYYPVYGDDSTAIEDAPTQGKFYVRLEKGRSHAMWGNFHTRITGTDLVRYNRGLYGVKLHLESDAQTEYGERRGQLELFAADPGTLPARDEFRGTGGSLYYLRRQDLTQGSERVWIEVRDRDSGIVLESKNLAPVQDYEINYLQGRVMLREPLSSTADDGMLVNSGSLSGHHAYLVATYEYAPGVTEADDMVRGGRAEYWVNDHLKLGLTGYRQHAPGSEQELEGADITLRYKPGTYLKLEGAQSDGSGHGSNNSLDGGFSFTGSTSPGGRADAGRVEGAFDFSALSPDHQGRASFYWQKREAGFSGPGEVTGTDDVEQKGAAVSWQITATTELRAKIDSADRGSYKTTAGEIDLHRQLSPNWRLSAGVRADSRDSDGSTASDTLNRDGDRTDLQLRADYTPDADSASEWSAYGYVQGTLDRSGEREGNDRIGVGGKRRINERFSVKGEASTGDGGFGGLFGGEYQLDDQTSTYLTYQLDTDRSDSGYRGRQGIMSAGARRRYSDHLSVFGEERLQHGDGPSGLTHAFGLDLSPDKVWTYGVRLEAGELADPEAGDMKRHALSFSVGYHKEKTKYAGNLEYRRERGDAGRRETWLWRNNLGYQVAPDWRFLGKLNLSFSDASAGSFYDGDFIEAVSGFAYRPVKNDRLNLLFKYTFFYNLPSPGQLDSGGDLADFSQRSHVLSLDGIYDLTPWLSVGGKYAFRLGEMRDNRDSGPWLDSRAQLGILRADLHWVHEWDMLVEGRILDVRAADETRSGFLVALYRHLGRHFKAGLGYNFTDFSDDLTDLSYTSGGWFINVIGKM